MIQGTALAGDDLPQVLDGLKKTYGHLDAISIPYTREVITRSMSMLGSQAKGDLATGTIYFRPPDLLRLEQEKPKVETIIANSTTMWWYIPDKKTAYEYKTGQFGKELSLMTNIFRGLVEVEDNFQVTLHGKNSLDEYEMELIPTPPWQEIQKIEVMATNDYRIRTTKIHNLLGSITIFMLGEFTEIHTLDERFFTFTAPKGVKVIVEHGG
jgi:outer membrane lipoprotein-sorting protein